MEEKKSQRHRVFYIDYENVASFGATGCERLDKKDKILIFIHGGAEHIGEKSAKAYIKTKAKIRFIDVDVGKPDALDFQLIMYIGLKFDDKKEHYIISRDKSYDYAVHMCSVLGHDNIHRYSNIADALDKVDRQTDTDKIVIENDSVTKCDLDKKTNVTKCNAEDKENVTKYETFCIFLEKSCDIDYDEVIYKDLYNAFLHTNSKVELFNKLRKKYKGPNNTCELYNKVKGHYDELVSVLLGENTVKDSRVYNILANVCSLPFDKSVYADILFALRQSNDKGEFYSILLKKYGTKKNNTVPFYGKIKGHYNSLKKASKC